MESPVTYMSPSKMRLAVLYTAADTGLRSSYGSMVTFTSILPLACPKVRTPSATGCAARSRETMVPGILAATAVVIAAVRGMAQIGRASCRERVF